MFGNEVEPFQEVFKALLNGVRHDGRYVWRHFVHTSLFCQLSYSLNVWDKEERMNTNKYEHKQFVSLCDV